MVENTPKGKEVRKYFIQVEKEWKKQQQKNMRLALEPFQEEIVLLKNKLDKYEGQKISPKQISVLKSDIKSKIAAIAKLRDENFIVPDFHDEAQMLRKYFGGAMFSEFPANRYAEAKKLIAERLDIGIFAKMWKIER